MRSLLSRTALSFILVPVSVLAVSAQDTRSELLSAEREVKAQQAVTVQPSAPNPVERTFSWAQSTATRLSDDNGFYPQLGGMITGSGLSAGPGYRHRIFGDRALVDASAAVSWKGYKMIDSRIEWPRAFAGRLTTGAEVRFQDFTQVKFFGIGENSIKAAATDFRLRDIDTTGFADVRPNEWLSIRGRVGVLRQLDIRPGTSSLYPPTGERFNNATAPGLSDQPPFIHADVAIAADTRDVPGYPSTGGRYSVSASTYHDQDSGHYSFQRVEADAVHYFPVFNKSWVLALRGRVALSHTGDGEEVPFYLLPALGGSNSLRGFDDYRFRDRDVMLMTAEYRWPIYRLLDGAVFYDAGTVAPTVGRLTSGHMKSDYGVGFRFHSSTRSVLRLDLAQSAEGRQMFLTFSAPLRSPSRAVAPYVP